jgi:protein O-GlcNAc transferase
MPRQHSLRPRGREPASRDRPAGIDTSSLAEYEALALALARDPERLTAVRAKLARNRGTEPLFDTARVTRNLEAAYTIMWDRTQRHEAPESFSVSDASAR